MAIESQYKKSSSNDRKKRRESVRIDIKNDGSINEWTDCTQPIFRKKYIPTGVDA
jgi:hypothetical protein